MSIGRATRRSLVAVATALTSLIWSGRAPAAEFEFWHALAGRYAQAVDALCDGFNASQSRDRVVCLRQGNYDDLRQKVVAAYRARRQPALTMMSDAATAEMLLSGATEAVSDLPNGMGHALEEAGFIPSVAAPYRGSGGHLLSLPFNVSTALLFADKRRLGRIGLSRPPETWEDVMAAATALKHAGDTCPLVLQTDHAWRLLEETSAAEGALIATPDNGFGGLAARYVFDRGVHLRLMTDLRRAVQDGLAIPHFATRAGRATEAFATGECAMSIESTASYATVEAAGRVDLVVGLLPIYAGTTRHNTVTGGASLWVMKGFDPAIYRAVAAFLRYLLRPESQLALTRVTGYLPVTDDAARRFLASANPADPDTAVVATAYKSLTQPGAVGSRGVRLGNVTQVFDAWGDEVTSAFAGRRTMRDAIARARERADALAARFARIYAQGAYP